MASASRINDTNTGQFDQVTTLSQQMINDQLATLMNSVSELKTFEPEPQTWGKYTCSFEDVQLDPCQCAIPVEQNNYSSVRFYINFKSGKFALDKAAAKHSAAEHKDYDMSGWVICFIIQMGLADVDEKKLPDVKEKLNIAGDYSIQRLYLDFTTANIAQLQLSQSHFGKYDFEKDFPGDFQKAFQLGIIEWLDTLNENATDICYHGTAVSSKALNPIEPTFPVENVLFQTYPFKDPSRQTGTGKDYNRNALLYLETCIPPVPSNTFLNWSGNFITNGDDSKSSVNGTMCISRKIFFDKFLLPLLKELNLRTQITPNSAKNELAVGYFEFWWSFKTGWDPEHTEPSDSYYDFEFVAPNPSFPNFQDRKYIWSRTKPEKTDNAGSTGFLCSNIHLKADVTNSLSWTAGGHELIFTTESHYRLETWNRQAGIANDTHVDVRIGFTMKLVFQSVSEGVLSIQTYYPIKDKPDNTNLESAIWTTGDTGASSIFEKNPGDQQGAIKAQYISGMGGSQWFTDRMQNVLKEHRWVFPGNGTFSFSDPCFNANGDLMCALAYDGLSKVPLTQGIGATPPIPVAKEPPAS